MADSFESRLAIWHRFRTILEKSKTPIEDVIDYWNKIPTALRNLDPYDQSTWPDPWEMIEENDYCEFTKLLAVVYTLKLMENFKDCQPIIKIALDKTEHSLYYILLINNQIIGLNENRSMYILQKEPKNLMIQKIHTLSTCY